MSEAPNDAAGKAGTGTPGGPSNWLESLPPDLTYGAKGADGQEQVLPLRDHPKLKGFKTPGDLANAWLNQEKALGARPLQPLGKDATPEQRQAFAAELRKLSGVPDKPEAYELTLPEGVQADENLLGWFRATAHKVGLPPAAAQEFMASYNAFAVEHLKQMEAAAMADAKAAVEKLWGKDAPAHVETAKRGFAAVAARAGLPKETADKFASLYGDEPLFLQVFKAIGDTFKEDGKVDGGGGGQDPGKSDAEVFYGPRKT